MNVGDKVGDKNENLIKKLFVSTSLDKYTLNGMECIIQEESYTSSSSFFDLDPLPIYKEEDKTEYSFSGKRIKRGLYQTKENKYINADINGALNIYRKSSVCDMKVIEYLLRRGVNTPRRLQVI